MAHPDAIPSAAFVVHPLAGWQRRILGIRHRDPGLLTGGPTDRVRRVATLRVQTALGPVDVHIISVPDLPAQLVEDQARALALQRAAGELAVELGASVIGLGSALAVVAGRGRALADGLSIPVTTGHAATAWACAEIARRVSGDEPVGVLGFAGTVGDAVAARLAGEREVWVEAVGKAAVRRAEAVGCRPADKAALLERCRVVVGAGTTGPSLAPGELAEGTTLVDLANPPTLQPGPRPTGVVELAGETLSWPGRVHGRFWGRIWRLLAGYERRSAYACLAEPLVAARLGEGPWSDGRRLDPDAVDAAGDALTRAGFQPLLTTRRG